MRPVYRRRRDALLAALARRLPWLEPSGISAGLHLVSWLPPHLDETTVVEAALRVWVGIDAVGPYRIASPGPGGLIFGYATASEQAIAEGVDILARVISQFYPATGPTGLPGPLDFGAQVRLRVRRAPGGLATMRCRKHRPAAEEARL